MTIDWQAFLTVVVGSLVSAGLLVGLFSLGLRLSDGTAPWRRPVSVALFVVCAAVVAFGIYLIVPFFHS
jgi:hypothetical protein